MKKNCCFDCVDREIGCHGWCPKYLAYAAERTRVLDNKFRKMDYFRINIMENAKIKRG